MKHATLATLAFAVSVTVSAPAALAVDLNTTALKTMQQQGHQLLEEAQDWRHFELKSKRCMQIAGGVSAVGANLVFRPCNATAQTQEFRFDDKGRLVSRGDTCVGVQGNALKLGASAIMQACDDSKAQQWELDDKNRLVNKDERCLQATGKPEQKQGNMILTKCSGSPNQVWEES
ncbi:hypothetical protein E4634_09725 [Mangrovimicrobium sediminis]|uniref:Ricin B lectin domain-containing protein n=1 Tax=Mangrovimicrobium sediminis TaxID=2562682 RepID=A0A4Z0M1J4_9GAMM|nr:RICIN domain-containing protein [Haliea sp. SAOS-164]TGD73307.1 hypothetical protein E4634_09725 [Haliea sp. SAOS-164]